jgi:CDP-diacylglycerol--serine O-phosphatidyltransferase
MPVKTKDRRPFFRRRKPRDESEGQADRIERRRNRIIRMKKGIFILPSLLTLCSIFFSFSAMVFALERDFFWAGVLVIFAAFFDGIDGKVARLTKTTSNFGLQLDSLADVISFGVAPALIMYLWALAPFSRLGWVSAFVFIACGALRLARFNVQSGRVDPRRFVGLPIPGAAAAVATTVIFFEKMGIDPANYRICLLIYTFLLSFFMVSAVKFHAFKDLGFAKKKPFAATVAFVLMLALIAVQPFVVPFALMVGYVLSGPALTIALHLKARQAAAQGSPEVKEADAGASH